LLDRLLAGILIHEAKGERPTDRQVWDRKGKLVERHFYTKIKDERLKKVPITDAVGIEYL